MKGFLAGFVALLVVLMAFFVVIGEFEKEGNLFFQCQELGYVGPVHKPCGFLCTDGPYCSRTNDKGFVEYSEKLGKPLYDYNFFELFQLGAFG